MSFLDELKESLNNKKAILGSRKTIKYLKAGKLKTIIIAKNCPENVKKDLEHYSKISKIKVERFDGTGKQLGVFCGKPFPIATIGIVK